MVKKISRPDRAAEYLESAEMYSIGEDFILLENPVLSTVVTYPFRLDFFIAAICLKGTVSGSIDLQPYTFNGPNLIVAFPGQILQQESFSSDFKGLIIIMSKKFISDLRINIKEALSLNLSLRQKPWIPLEGRGLESLIHYYSIMKETIQLSENPYRMEIARHLTVAFFFGAGFYFHLFKDSADKSKQEIIVEKFLDLTQMHYREEREVNFYAKLLLITPKHLSKVVRESSGKSANDWINDYVILEAKALLKSTNMTIQQISDELNFPSQSFFGKYFKRCTGMSPREYKKG
jgi:AraC-like DNA-binding protein